MNRQFNLKIDAFSKPKAAVTCILTGHDLEFGPEAKSIWAKTGRKFDEIAAAANFEGKKTSFLSIYTPDHLDTNHLLIAGIGDLDSDSDLNAYAALGGTIINHLRSINTDSAEIKFDIAASSQQIASVAAGMRLGDYRFDKYKSAPKESDQTPLALNISFQVSDPGNARKADKLQDSVTQGTIAARNLVNEPANRLGTEEFVHIIKDLDAFGLDVEILDEKQMQDLGMGSLLAVGRGSERPSYLAIMKWNGGKKNAPPVAFVGKGVVFDSGGLSLKPAGSMEDMKCDMSGAAAVTGIMKTLGLRKARVNAVGVVGLVENMPDGNAMRPGDIVESMSGQTIEILNTDAEGRLVLADALWYTKETFSPEVMINLATLTGANLIALGQQHAGLFSNDDALANGLLEAGLETGERVWRMPMGPDYDKLLESKNADMKNIGGRLAGAITAAQFLKRFVGDAPWAHIDLSTAAGIPLTSTNQSWGTGFGVALLDKFVREKYA